MAVKKEYKTCSNIRIQEGDSEEKKILPAQDPQYQSFIVKYNQNVYGSAEYVSDHMFQIINEYFAIAYVPMEKAGEPEINSYSYHAIPKCYTYMDIESLNASGVTRLHDHPYLKLRGKNTLVAIIDSGIDYTHPAFTDKNGSKILRLWDQSILGDGAGKAPFGRVFSQKEINEALESEDPYSVVPSYDENGHGTMIAGTAAGYTIQEEEFSGAAPEASLIVIKLKQAKEYLKNFYLIPSEAEVFQEDDLMLAIAYAIKWAKEFGMPLSICIGLGTNQGAHLGYSPLNEIADSAATFSQNSISIAAGNEGMARHHYEGVLDESGRADTVDLRVGDNTDGFTMEMWGTPSENYLISIQSPTGEKLNVSTAVKAATQELSFVFVETKIFVNYIRIERQSGNTLIYFRFVHPAAGLWRIQIAAEKNGKIAFHIWLPAKGMIADDTYFLQPSPYFTVTSPGDSKKCMTVTAYQHLSNSLFIDASRGFLPDGQIKPNFAAPGVDIRVPLINGGFGRASGSSLAAAQTAGIAALMFEWAVIRGNEPFFTGNSVKNYLQTGTRKEDNLIYPNPEWGYGRVDLYHTFELLT